MELKNGTENVVDECKSYVSDAGSDRDDVPAERGTLEQDQQNFEVAEACEGTPAGQSVTSTPEPREKHGNELPSGNNVDSGEFPEVKPLCCEGSVIFEVRHDDDGLPMLDLESSAAESSSPVMEEEEAGEEEGEVEEVEGVASPDEGDTDCEELVQLLQQLHAEREEASVHSSRLQVQLLEYFKRSGEDAQVEKRRASEQELCYEKHISTLAELKQHHTTNSGSAQQQAEQLRLQSQERLSQVESEWRAFVALKQDVAVARLRQHLGKQAAQAKLEPVLASEQRQQDELVQMHLEHIKLKIRTRKLEDELHTQGELANDLQQLEFEKLQAKSQKFNEKMEKQSEELLRLRNKISSTTLVLTSVKQKLQWSQVERRSRQAQLAELEATVAGKRNLLTQIKQARNCLHRDNLRLRQPCGLLWNSVLQRDFQDSMDTSVQLQDRLANLKRQTAVTPLKMKMKVKTT
ncbi:cilia- and flagella-associated protein 184 [Myripristis murdjan]|uniref:cilia- and flagella-associated protein 184 n=1 Tax=Myripristis murdjan TaxID=586833 RepID=UPI001175F8A1|nr:coiled-coil domain-containing protein 96 [Myripristis murdjan]XP_029931999.1 coiled-coil domain-containing protein 96 [Myripristis murdjan]